eukprot:Awhi_evm2s7407
MEVSETDVFVLSFAFNLVEEPKNLEQGQLETWVSRCPIMKFCDEVDQISYRIGQVLSEKQEEGKDNYIGTFDSVCQWLDMAAENWKTIERFPNLCQFADVTEMKNNRLLESKCTLWENEVLISQKNKHEDFYQNLLAVTINTNKIHVTNYITQCEVEIKKKIRDYFENIKKLIFSKLSQFAFQEHIKKGLVDQYKRTLSHRVNSYCHEILIDATEELQKNIMEAEKVTGKREIEHLLKLVLRSDQKLSIDEASEKFDVSWNKTIADMHSQLNFYDCRQQLFETINDCYQQYQSFPNSIMNNEKLKNDILNSICSQPLELAADRFANFFFAEAQNIFKPVQNNTDYQNISVRFMHKLRQDWKYLAVTEFFDFELHKYEIDAKKIFSSTDFASLCDHISRIFHRSGKKSQSRKELKRFLESYLILGFSLKPNFIDDICKIFFIRSWYTWASTPEEELFKYLQKKFVDCFKKETLVFTNPTIYDTLSTLYICPTIISSSNYRITDNSDLNKVVKSISEPEDRICMKLAIKNHSQWDRRTLQALEQFMKPRSIENNYGHFNINALKGAVFEKLKLKWAQMLKDLCVYIHKDILLPNDESNISRFTVSLVNIIYTKVKLFIKNNVNSDLEKFGLNLDMDGNSIIHFFSSIYTCSVLAKDTSKAVAKHLLTELTTGFLKEAQAITVSQITKDLNDSRNEFTSEAIQKNLDNNLLFSPRAEKDCVVHYITHQTEYVIKTFEEKFEQHFDAVKENYVLLMKRKFDVSIKNLVDVTKELLDFIEKNDLDKSSHHLFNG